MHKRPTFASVYHAQGTDFCKCISCALESMQVRDNADQRESNLRIAQVSNVTNSTNLAAIARATARGPGGVT